MDDGEVVAEGFCGCTNYVASAVLQLVTIFTDLGDDGLVAQEQEGQRRLCMVSGDCAWFDDTLVCIRSSGGWKRMMRACGHGGMGRTSTS